MRESGTWDHSAGDSRNCVDYSSAVVARTLGSNLGCDSFGLVTVAQTVNSSRRVVPAPHLLGQSDGTDSGHESVCFLRLLGSDVDFLLPRRRRAVTHNRRIFSLRACARPQPITLLGGFDT